MSRIPFLDGFGAPRRLAGLTNLNYRIGPYVLRLPGEGTSAYINRADEAVAARSAAAAGVNAQVMFFDPADGLMVTRFVEGAVTMSPERFVDLGAVARAGQAFRRLHTSAAPFATEFRLFAMIDEYKSLLAAKNAPLPDGYEEIQRQAAVARTVLAQHNVATVACHCDPLCENFLDTGEQMYLIDYEYAGNNDPMWDLGDLSVEAGFSPEQDAALLHAYFDGDVPPIAAARMVVHKAMCDLLWTLWGVIQHVNGNPADDFWAYALRRFHRCQTLISSPEFAGAIDTLAATNESPNTFA